MKSHYFSLHGKLPMPIYFMNIAESLAFKQCYVWSFFFSVHEIILFLLWVHKKTYFPLPLESRDSVTKLLQWKVSGNDRCQFQA